MNQQRVPGHVTSVRGRAFQLGIALFEYLLQVRVNRIGHTELTLPN